MTSPATTSSPTASPLTAPTAPCAPIAPATRRPTGRRRVLALLLTLASSLVMLFAVAGAPASAAVPSACTSPTVSLPRVTGVTFTGYSSARCNQWYFLRTQVKENGVVIRDNYQAQWQQPWASSGLYTTPNFSCVTGRGYQAVAIVYFYNGTSSYGGGYWTTGAPRTLC